MVNLWLEIRLDVDEDSNGEEEADDGVVMGLLVVVGYIRGRDRRRGAEFRVHSYSSSKNDDGCVGVDL
jgi:hypothetical protein